MPLNRKQAIKTIFLLALCVLLPLRACSQSIIDKEHKDLFRIFMQLSDDGKPDVFSVHAAKYEQYLLDHQLVTEYYKIRTNEGFYYVNHNLLIPAIEVAKQMEEMMKENHDTAHHYLVTGLWGDIQKAMRTPLADSIYQQALIEVGDRDPKFTMLTHISLAQVNHLSDPKKSVEWANRALSEAERLNNLEFRSRSLGIKAYVLFMTGEKDEFEATALQYQQVKDEYNELVANKTVGYQILDTHYDNVIDVAKKAFSGDFKEAHKLAQTNHLNVERQLVIFRLHGMEGSYAKDQSIKKLTWWLTILTCLYIFVYFMGRRRLMKKIWKRSDELRVALEKADAANQMKASFIRSMSHEIRTPLNAINGFTGILCDDEGQLSENEKADIKERITSSSEAITIIINELLEVAANESVTLDLNDLTPVKINNLCRQAEALAEEHNDKGLEISFTSELDDDFAIRSNDEIVMRILKKILSNALKFTAEGSIELHAAQHGQYIDISVTDTGVGIPEDKHGIIFDNFVKLDEFKDGVGLGLSISRRLAKLLGGDITIDNSYKKGSRFILQLPVIN